MRLAYTAACVFVAWDCGEKAVGISPQYLFTGRAAWLWWLCAALWAFFAMVAALEKRP